MASLANIPAILTSNSSYKSYLDCQRKRYWEYEHLNEDGSRGLERKTLSLPLSTGGWCHKVVQGLFLLTLVKQHLAYAPQSVLSAWEEWGKELGQGAPTNASEVILACSQGYVGEVRRRGLEIGLSLDGFVAEEKFLERTIREQSALVEAFGWAYLRVRLPRILEEYWLIGVEQEEFTLLSGDVGLQSRCDAILRRKSDDKLFVYNLKTASSPDSRKWQELFEVDQQLMTETLAVERRLNEKVYGVIIDGFEKGQRVEMWWDSLKEVRGSSPQQGEKWQGQRSRLLYGYKCEDIPGRPPLYDFEGTTRKGWYKFAVFENDFTGTNIASRGETPVEQWVNWLPIEQVEGMFAVLPPIMRSDEHVQRKVVQIVGQEVEIRVKRELVEHGESLDLHFVQNESHCIRFGTQHKCPMFQKCWSDHSDDLYQPRKKNHPEVED